MAGSFVLRTSAWILESGGGESRRKGSREMGFKRDADFDFDKEANFEVVLDLTGDGAD